MVNARFDNLEEKIFSLHLANETKDPIIELENRDQRYLSPSVI